MQQAENILSPPRQPRDARMLDSTSFAGREVLAMITTRLVFQIEVHGNKPETLPHIAGADEAQERVKGKRQDII